MKKAFILGHHTEIGQLLFKLMILLFGKSDFSAICAYPWTTHGFVCGKCFIESVALLFLDVTESSDKWKGLLQYVVHIGLYLVLPD